MHAQDNQSQSARPMAMSDYQNIYAANPSYAISDTKYIPYYNASQYNHSFNKAMNELLPVDSSTSYGSLDASMPSHPSNYPNLAVGTNGKISYQNEMLFTNSMSTLHPELRSISNAPANHQDGKASMVAPHERRQSTESNQHGSVLEKRKQDDESVSKSDSSSSVVKRKRADFNQQDLDASTLLLNLLQDSPDGDSASEEDGDEGSDD
jgi:hypothetical protein